MKIPNPLSILYSKERSKRSYFSLHLSMHPTSAVGCSIIYHQFMGGTPFSLHAYYLYSSPHNDLEVFSPKFFSSSTNGKDQKHPYNFNFFPDLSRVKFYEYLEIITSIKYVIWYIRSGGRNWIINHLLSLKNNVYYIIKSKVVLHIIIRFCIIYFSTVPLPKDSVFFKRERKRVIERLLSVSIRVNLY